MNAKKMSEKEREGFKLFFFKDINENAHGQTIEVWKSE